MANSGWSWSRTSPAPPPTMPVLKAPTVMLLPMPAAIISSMVRGTSLVLSSVRSGTDYTLCLPIGRRHSRRDTRRRMLGRGAYETHLPVPLEAYANEPHIHSLVDCVTSSEESVGTYKDSAVRAVADREGPGETGAVPDVREGHVRPDTDDERLPSAGCWRVGATGPFRVAQGDRK